MGGNTDRIDPALLGPDLGAQVSWPVTDDPIPDSPMARCFNDTWQIHKNDNYIPVYESIFSPYRDRPIRMLEIGVSRGGSLQLWRRYFHPDSIIVGLDINPGCARFNDHEHGICVRIGDQADIDHLNELIDEFGRFDIVLDDGSHLPTPTLTSFQHLFAHGLADGGVYLVEDLWFCYMPVGQDEHCPTFVDVVKYLIDVMHQEWVGHNTLDAFSLEGARLLAEHPGSADQIAYGTVDPLQATVCRVPNPYRIREHRVPLAATLIAGIEVYDGIVAIHRQPRHPPNVLLNVTGEF